MVRAAIIDDGDDDTNDKDVPPLCEYNCIEFKTPFGALEHTYIVKEH